MLNNLMHAVWVWVHFGYCSALLLMKLIGYWRKVLKMIWSKLSRFCQRYSLWMLNLVHLQTLMKFSFISMSTILKILFTNWLFCVWTLSPSAILLDKGEWRFVVTILLQFSCKHNAAGCAGKNNSSVLCYTN